MHSLSSNSLTELSSPYFYFPHLKCQENNDNSVVEFILKKGRNDLRAALPTYLPGSQGVKPLKVITAADKEKVVYVKKYEIKEIARRCGVSLSLFDRVQHISDKIILHNRLIDSMIARKREMDRIKIFESVKREMAQKLRLNQRESDLLTLGLETFFQSNENDEKKVELFLNTLARQDFTSAFAFLDIDKAPFHKKIVVRQLLNSTYKHIQERWDDEAEQKKIPLTQMVTRYAQMRDYLNNCYSQEYIESRDLDTLVNELNCYVPGPIASLKEIQIEYLQEEELGPTIKKSRHVFYYGPVEEVKDLVLHHLRPFMASSRDLRTKNAPSPPEKRLSNKIEELIRDKYPLLTEEEHKMLYLLAKNEYIRLAVIGYFGMLLRYNEKEYERLIPGLFNETQEAIEARHRLIQRGAQIIASESRRALLEDFNFTPAQLAMLNEELSDTVKKRWTHLLDNALEDIALKNQALRENLASSHKT